MSHNFKELNVWVEAKDFAVTIYKISETFPQTETYTLTNQINRAAISIASNIAEGAGRSSQKDFSRFISIALGSSFELETQLIIAKELNYLIKVDYKDLINQLDKIQKMLVNFNKHLQNN